MADPTAAVPQPSAEYVAHKFAITYYDVVGTRPDHLFRFYKEESHYSHADGPDEKASKTTATGPTEINQVITACLGQEKRKIKVNAVDCQNAPDGAIIVAVTGTLMSSDKSISRQFVQTFLLCVQETGYYVRNDIFRFIQPSPNGQVDDAVSGYPQPSLEQDTPGVTVQEAVPPPEPDSPAAPTPAQALPDEEQVPSATIVAETQVPPPAAPQPAVEDTPPAVASEAAVVEVQDSQEPVPDAAVDRAADPEEAAAPKQTSAPSPQEVEAAARPRSWASVCATPMPGSKEPQQPSQSAVEANGPSAAEPSPTYEEHATATSAAAPAMPATQAETVPPPPADTRPADTTPVTVGPSIWVSQLPHNLAARQLEDMMVKEFSRYGKVLGVDVRIPRGFAFIDMDSWDSVNVAVQAWAAGTPPDGPFKGMRLNVQVRKQPPIAKGRGLSRTASSGRGGPGSRMSKAGLGAEERRASAANRNGRSGSRATPNGSGGIRGRGRGTAPTE